MAAIGASLGEAPGTQTYDGEIVMLPSGNSKRKGGEKLYEAESNKEEL